MEDRKREMFFLAGATVLAAIITSIGLIIAESISIYFSPPSHISFPDYQSPQVSPRKIDDVFLELRSSVLDNDYLSEKEKLLKIREYDNALKKLTSGAKENPVGPELGSGLESGTDEISGSRVERGTKERGGIGRGNDIGTGVDRDSGEASDTGARNGIRLYPDAGVTGNTDRHGDLGWVINRSVGSGVLAPRSTETGHGIPALRDSGAPDDTNAGSGSGETSDTDARNGSRLYPDAGVTGNTDRRGDLGWVINRSVGSGVLAPRSTETGHGIPALRDSGAPDGTNAGSGSGETSDTDARNGSRLYRDTGATSISDRRAGFGQVSDRNLGNGARATHGPETGRRMRVVPNNSATIKPRDEHGVGLNTGIDRNLDAGTSNSVDSGSGYSALFDHRARGNSVTEVNTGGGNNILARGRGAISTTGLLNIPSGTGERLELDELKFQLSGGKLDAMELLALLYQRKLDLSFDDLASLHTLISDKSVASHLEYGGKFSYSNIVAAENVIESLISSRGPDDAGGSHSITIKEAVSAALISSGYSIWSIVVCMPVVFLLLFILMSLLKLRKKQYVFLA